MEGLLDWIKTPEGQGLLSMVAVGMAGAQKGQPINSLGRAFTGGLQGYGAAQERQQRATSEADAKKLRDLQLTQLTGQVDKQTAMDKAAKDSFAMPDQGRAGYLTTGSEQTQMLEGQGMNDNPEILKESMAFGDRPATVGGGGINQYIKTMQSIDPVKAYELQSQIKKANAPTVSPAGSVARDANGNIVWQNETNKAPETRKVQIGNEEVTQELDSATKSWKEVARGPKWQPKDQQDILSGKQKTIEIERGMAKEHAGQSANFIAGRDAYTQLKSTLSGANNSAASTLAAATKFMKLIDPGSVVRESELGMALNAQGVYERMGNYMHQLEIGKNLTPDQVKDFNETSQKIYDASAEGQKLLDSEYTRQAKEYGLTPSHIVRDYFYKEPAKPQVTTATGTARDPILVTDDNGYNNVSKGKYYTAPDGSVRMKR